MYGSEDVDKCLYCEEPDLITHTFVDCRSSQTFLSRVLSWFNEKYCCTFSPTPQETFFGMTSNNEKDNNSNALKLNYCLLFAKYKRNSPKCDQADRYEIAHTGNLGSYSV